MKLIIANWKIYLGAKESVALARRLSKIKSKNQLVVCPSFPVVSEVKKALGKNIKLGAQNVAQKPDGALTGEVSAGMLSSLGCQYVIVGHSERRHTLSETDAQIKEKLRVVVSSKMIPVLCVGETLSERKSGKTIEIVRKQLSVLRGLKFENLVIAYEPVWAIGTGLTPTLEQISEVHKTIKKVIGKLVSKTKVLYGGSVDKKNAQKILSLAEVDGALIGRASTDYSSLKKIIQ
jgi:triosephosphate isomerase